MECETEPYYSGIMAQTAVIGKCDCAHHHDGSEVGRLDERIYEDVPDYIELRNKLNCEVIVLCMFEFMVTF